VYKDKARDTHENIQGTTKQKIRALLVKKKLAKKV